MPKTARDLLSAARAVVPEVTVADVERDRAGAHPRLLLDVRDRDEFEQGYIPGATHLSKGNLEMNIEARIPDRTTPITLYCASGNRSLFAGRTLQTMGYEDVVSLAGGFNAWKQKGLAFDTPRTFTPEQKIRYSRHFLVGEVGEKGQAKLLDAKVLVIGAGGLGAPVLLYLAAAGVGTIGIVDFDTVDLSNLQRQVIHTTDRIGLPKTESAKIAIAAMNPDVRVIEHREMLNSENAARLFEQYDIIVNGCDNFPTRYLTNDVAIWTRKPVVDGGIFQFDGTVTTIIPFQSPCYRCRYPVPPPPEEAPSCAEAGVLGVLPGTIGLLQATEVIKLILGIGTPLTGVDLQYDALEQRFRRFRIPRDPACPVCGENPTITEPIDYEGFCLMPNLAHAPEPEAVTA